MPRARGCQAPLRVQAALVVDYDLDIGSGCGAVIESGKPGISCGLGGVRDGDEVDGGVRRRQGGEGVEGLFCNFMAAWLKLEASVHIDVGDVHGQPQCRRKVMSVGFLSGRGNARWAVDGAEAPTVGIGEASMCLGQSQDESSC